MDEQTTYELWALCLVFGGLFGWALICWLIGWVWDKVSGGK